jgi:hypothetical protein
MSTAFSEQDMLIVIGEQTMKLRLAEQEAVEARMVVTVLQSEKADLEDQLRAAAKTTKKRRAKA